MRRSSWLSSLELSRHSIRGASTSDWAALRELTGSPPVRCDGIWKPTPKHDVHELRHFFEAADPGQAVRAIPGVGLNVPLFILGSSVFGASVAATLGLPFAFASHFAPDALKAALDLYRARFKPSRQLERPYVMVAANVVVAEREADARRLFTSLQQMSLYTLRGSPAALPQPVDDLKLVASAAEFEALNQMFTYSFE